MTIQDILFFIVAIIAIGLNIYAIRLNVKLHKLEDENEWLYKQVVVKTKLINIMSDTLETAKELIEGGSDNDETQDKVEQN